MELGPPATVHTTLASTVRAHCPVALRYPAFRAARAGGPLLVSRLRPADQPLAPMGTLAGPERARYQLGPRPPRPDGPRCRRRRWIVSGVARVAQPIGPRPRRRAGRARAIPVPRPLPGLARPGQ